MLLNVHSHYRKVTQEIIRKPDILQIQISSFLRACFSSPITGGNGGHCPVLGSDSARGFSDAVIVDGFAIDRII